MTFEEAIATQPAWIFWWLNALFFGAYVLPFSLLIWRSTRLAGFLTVVASFASGFAINAMYDSMGLVRLLGLPHVLLWTPLVIYLIVQVRKPEIPTLPRWIMMTVIGLILVSLAFDYVDLLRYVLGNRTPLTERA
ncbi:hypothetical protein [uncultured Roseobacter sp.]|uniref:hypothetical protein n=1 Tax=uncultured Roseobacter sp. TaxID=114847 RepID=UPI00262E78A3|nr:hypothetical protein [uncultured Roseobacter sp.]